MRHCSQQQQKLKVSKSSLNEKKKLKLDKS